MNHNIKKKKGKSVVFDYEYIIQEIMERQCGLMRLGRVWYYVLYLIIFLIWYICNTSFPNGDLGIYNFICVLLSTLFVIIGLRRVLNEGIKCYTVFQVSFFGVLIINTFNLSSLQTPKMPIDLYFYFFGGLIFEFFLFCGEYRHTIIKNKKIKQINKNILFSIIFGLYILLSCINFVRNGIPVLHGAFDPGSLNEFKEAGISGITLILGFILLIFTCDVKKTGRWKYYLLVIIIDGVLKYSRGNMFRIILFGLMFFAKRNLFKNSFFIEKAKKYRRYIVLLLVLIFVGFGIVGNIRTTMRGERVGSSSSDWINRTNNIDMGLLGWVYGYTAINFDTMKMAYQGEPLNNISTVIAPFQRLMGNSKAMVKYTETHEYNGEKIKSDFSVNSMKTFLAPYIQDLGIWFFLELSIVGFFYSFFISFARNRGYDGLYSYILMLTTLCISGNYIFNTSYLYVIIGTVFLFAICTEEGEKEKC